jgi:BirA family biotin operon repressor/biotin-[acetyl-CoA-carboxylase] ligase
MMPGDQVVEGNAIDLDGSGRLLIAVDGQEQFYAVAAGDIVHLRHN